MQLSQKGNKNDIEMLILSMFNVVLRINRLGKSVLGEIN